MFTELLYDLKDGVATISLNRPQASNGFNIPLCLEVLQALDCSASNEAVKVVVLRGIGKVFSVGGDLVEMQRAVDEDDVASLVKIAELVNQISFAIKQLPKPVIALVDGPVAGAAFNMVVASDFCIASDRSRFIQAFVNVNLAPDAGGLFLLTRSLGVNRATQLTMTAEAVTAEKGLEFGFVYRTCPPEKLEQALAQLLKKLNRASYQSYAVIKKMIWQSEFLGWEAYAKQELTWQSELAMTADFKEGVRAYTEKRRPNFTGD